MMWRTFEPVEIHPGTGVDEARIGETRTAIEAPSARRAPSAMRVYYDELDPALCIDYDAAGNVRSV